MLILVSKTGCLCVYCLCVSHIFHELRARIVYQFLESCTDCMWRFKNPLLDHRVLEPTDPWPSQARRREDKDQCFQTRVPLPIHVVTQLPPSHPHLFLSLFPQTALSSFFQESNIPSHHQMVSVFSMEREGKWAVQCSTSCHCHQTARSQHSIWENNEGLDFLKATDNIKEPEKLLC